MNRPLHPKLILLTFTLLISSTKGSLDLVPTLCPQFWTVLIPWTWFFFATHHGSVFHFLPLLFLDFSFGIRERNICEYQFDLFSNLKIYLLKFSFDLTSWSTCLYVKGLEKIIFKNWILILKEECSFEIFPWENKKFFVLFLEKKVFFIIQKMFFLCF